jgi:hypothetical protein
VSTESETKKPLLIQIDDVIREMTLEEVTAHEKNLAIDTDSPSVPSFE